MTDKKKFNASDFEKDIKNYMEQVGTYEESFCIVINHLARLIEDYERAREQFEEMDCQMMIEHTNKNGSTNLIKNPIYQSIEKIRMDILSYLKELGLTPSGLKKINQDVFKETKVESPLVDVLKRLM